MNHPDALLFAGIAFGAALAAFLIRFGIRSYFREKNNHLARLMESAGDQDKEKEN